jgi:RND family efflux transporter MFP subunit
MERMLLIPADAGSPPPEALAGVGAHYRISCPDEVFDFVMTLFSSFHHARSRRLLAAPLSALSSLLLVAVSIPGCSRGGEAASSGGGAGAGGGPPAVPVTVAVVQPTTVEESTEYIATVKALQSTSVRPQVEGHIVRIFVKSGDRVRRGTPLVQIDPARQQASLTTQEASVDAREADVAFARQQYERLRDLFAQKVVSKAELDQAETAMKTAEAGLAETRAQVREERVQLQYFHLVAPTSGMIGDIPVRVGDRVGTDTQITTIDSNDVLEILVPIPSERAAALRPGLRLEVLGPDGQVISETTATFISPRVDPETQAVLVKGTVRNTGGHLRSQQFLRTRVIWASREGLTVPVLAVARISGQTFVFVAEQQDGREVARQRPVKLGAIVGDSYAVVGGIEAGDRVVVSGAQKLGDGVPIAVQAAT